MEPAKVLAQLRAQKTEKLTERTKISTQLAELRGKDEVDADEVNGLLRAKQAIDDQVDALEAQIDSLQREIEADRLAEERSREIKPDETLPKREASTATVTVVSEERTYHPGNDRNGQVFLRDVARAALGDFEAMQRISRHTQEEIVIRGGLSERAVGSGAFAGTVVPQYLTDLYAPSVKAGRPLADNCRHHDLPEKGMSLEISRVTTATTAAVQSAENAAVSETDIDDTLLSIPVRTAAGSQTVSRQVVDRGTGSLDITIDDLVRSHNAALDSALINTATVGLSDLATAVAYTDASPTAAELYPKLLAAAAAVETALLDQDAGSILTIMHGRRWRWLQAALTTSWPLINSGGAAQSAGSAAPGGYGPGIRGYLPSDTPVIVDANVPIAEGAGTNEDEIYVIPASEAHLWEDPNAPFMIRAEQTNAKSLGLDLVVYSYFAFTFSRYPTAIQKIGGTGLVTPTF